LKPERPRCRRCAEYPYTRKFAVGLHRVPLFGVAKRRRAALWRVGVVRHGDAFSGVLDRANTWLPSVVRSVLSYSLCASLLSLSLLGCGDAPQSGASGPAGPRPTPGCRAPAGVSNSPRTIDETVKLINALPKPLSLPCFLESLARPLDITATYGIFSAQPAHGARSPRIFILQEPNVMSVVPEGDGANLLEFGEERPEFRSLKGEIVFPVTTDLPRSAPFDQLFTSPPLTTCGGCHAGELQESEVLGVRTFTSVAFRPRPSEVVSAAAIEREFQLCDHAREPQRCAMLDALMGWGAVRDRAFPVGMSTFGGL